MMWIRSVVKTKEEGSNIGMNLDLSGLHERMEKGTAYDEVIAEAVTFEYQLRLWFFRVLLPTGAEKEYCS